MPRESNFSFSPPDYAAFLDVSLPPIIAAFRFMRNAISLALMPRRFDAFVTIRHYCFRYFFQRALIAAIISMPPA